MPTGRCLRPASNVTASSRRTPGLPLMRVCGPAPQQPRHRLLPPEEILPCGLGVPVRRQAVPTMGHMGKTLRHDKSLQPRSRPLPRFALPLALCILIAGGVTATATAETTATAALGKQPDDIFTTLAGLSQCLDRRSGAGQILCALPRNPAGEGLTAISETRPSAGTTAITSAGSATQGRVTSRSCRCLWVAWADRSKPRAAH